VVAGAGGHLGVEGGLLLGDGQVSMLPRGVEQYLEHRAEALRLEDEAIRARDAASSAAAAEASSGSRPRAGSAEERAARKTLARIDRQLARIAEQQAELDVLVAAHADVYERLAELSASLGDLAAERDRLEVEWLEAAELLDD
jgi:ATP-binding cassette subfamily F protein uup